MTARKPKPWEYKAAPLRKVKPPTGEDPEPEVSAPDPTPIPPVLTDTVPTARKAAPPKSRTTVAVCLELLAAPPTRAEAVERLVATFRAEVREVQRQRWTTTVLDGSPVADAAADYLLAEAVGLTA